MSTHVAKAFAKVYNKFGNAEFVNQVLAKPEKYMVKQTRVRAWLQSLRTKHNIFLFALTNAGFDHANALMKYSYGDDWVSLFDIVIVSAGKKKFFAAPPASTTTATTAAGGKSAAASASTATPAASAAASSSSSARFRNKTFRKKFVQVGAHPQTTLPLSQPPVLTPPLLPPPLKTVGPKDGQA